MYRPHMGARLLPVQIKVPEIGVTGIAGNARMAGLSASASIRDKRMAVTLTNPSLTDTVASRIVLGGGTRASEVKATILTHADMRAQNTFAKPEEVKPATHTATVDGAAIRLTVPKQSVVALDVLLA
jgi:alpha-N-arabinofuranosidase